MDTQAIGKRFDQLLNGDVSVSPLVWLWGAVPSFAVQNVGLPAIAAYNDPEKSFDAQVKTIAMFGEDGIPRIAVGGASDVTWAFGGEIKWPTGEFDMAPTAVRYPVNSEKEAAAMTVPEDIATTGPLPLYLTFAHLQKDHGYPVFTFITSPIEGARSLCGPERLMRWMITKPDLVHHLLRVATDYSIAVVQLLVKTFPDTKRMIYVAAPTASNQMISPLLFETFVLPYQIELHEKALAAGIGHIYCHICGEQNKNLSLWQQVPMGVLGGDPGIVSFGHEVDIKTAVEMFGSSCIIAGNIEPGIIHLGDDETVYGLCRDALMKGRRAPHGFILMPGCGIPPNVPPYNLYMFKKAAMDYRKQCQV